MTDASTPVRSAARSGGYFSIVERVKELIKYHGYQIAPAELEALLLGHPKVMDAAVIGVLDDEREEIPKAFIVAAPDSGLTEDEAAYLLVLENALLDRSISRTEGRQLADTAELAGLRPETVQRLHRDYLRSVAVEALDDGVVTADERRDLGMVAAALGFTSDDVDESLQSAQAQNPHRTSGFALQAGDRVVFTGDMARSRDEWITTVVAAGLTSGGVTKATRMVVAADPDSLSGKAAKARQYGIPVVGEATFEKIFAKYLTTS